MQDYTLDQIQDIVTEARQAAKDAAHAFGRRYGKPRLVATNTVNLCTVVSLPRRYMV